jgi:hypothetical protein
MHIITSNIVQAWANWFPHSTVAEVGSYDINGNLRCIFPYAIGFDVIAGPNVDVVHLSGKIPKEYQGIFSSVFSVSALQCCPKPEDIVEEIYQLLIPEGVFLVTTCSENCKQVHRSSSDITLDKTRLPIHELQNLFSKFEDVHIFQTVGDNHPQNVITGKKKIPNLPIFIKIKIDKS